MTHGPLSRFTVLDLTRVRAGPACVRQLSDWGATAIKIEAPAEDTHSGERHGSDFQNLQRNKRSLVLDLKQSEGVATFKRLVTMADVVVENYRPGVKHKLGIDYESLNEINPRLVYGSISGFGQDGPYAERPGVDQIVQGMGGLMSITGLPGQGPVRVGIAIADMAAGIYCAFGILAALHEREVSGCGQWVQTSLLQALIAMLDMQASRWTMDGEVPGQAGNDHPTSIPTGVYECVDGHINIGASGDVLFRRLCVAMGAEYLLEDPRYQSEKSCNANKESLNKTLNEITRSDTCDSWVDRLNDAGVPCGPIYRMDEVFADPQVQHLEMARLVEHPKLGNISLVNQPIIMSRTPPRMDCAGPDQGEHSEEVLREFGFGDDEIETLRSKGVF